MSDQTRAALDDAAMTDQWTCPTCRERYVVASLAEMCKRKHDQEDE